MQLPFKKDKSTNEVNQTDHESTGSRNGSKSKPQMTVLNEGAIVIRRQGRADTSDEESDSEEDQVVELAEPEEEAPPPRDPLEVEEEMLNEKLQTAGFFLSMPEEEQIKKRLLEIKQMRDNPDWFKVENTKVLKKSIFLYLTFMFLDIPRITNTAKYQQKLPNPALPRRRKRKFYF